MSDRRSPGRRLWLLAAALASVLLGGCVYYNGMYNTKRLARSAQRAEREGRTFEANNLWGQVITRAESLVTRHPQSKYVDEALVFQGVALARLRQCPAAVAPLGRASLLPAKNEIAETAALALGRCQMELGDPAAADLAFVRVTESTDSARRNEARLHHARALRQSGRPAESLAALEGLHGLIVEDERLLALGASGRDAEALTLADSLLANGDSTRGWDTLVVGLGRQNPALASRLVDLLGRRPNQQPAVHAGRLVEDGLRLVSVDSVRAAQRLREAATIGAGTEPGDRAALRLIRLDLTRVRDSPQLTPVAAALQQMAGRDGAVAGEASQLRLAVQRVQGAADSISPAVAQGDLRLFLTAELARDSLAAPALAAALFRRIAEGWPDSPYAPKALLAGQQLDPLWGDSARSVLVERYGASPYLAFLRGEAAEGYRQLEDSLRAFALAHGATPAPPRARPGINRPNQPILRPRPGQPPSKPRRELEP
jgi:hypothetical protein